MILHSAVTERRGRIDSRTSTKLCTIYVRKWLASGHRGAFETKSKKLQQQTSDRYSHTCAHVQSLSGRGIKCPE